MIDVIAWQAASQSFTEVFLHSEVSDVRGITEIALSVLSTGAIGNLGS